MIPRDDVKTTRRQDGAWKYYGLVRNYKYVVLVKPRGYNCSFEKQSSGKMSAFCVVYFTFSWRLRALLLSEDATAFPWVTSEPQLAWADNKRLLPSYRDCGTCFSFWCKAWDAQEEHLTLFKKYELFARGICPQISQYRPDSQSACSLAWDYNLCLCS